MRDIWAVLLQTLTVSGAAALVLLLKGMFTGRLSPRWQCAAWLILLPPLLLPAGRFGRYVLVNWPLAVETVKSLATGRFDTLTTVYAPIPLPPRALPGGWAEWLFALYFLAAVLLLGRDVRTYLRLRRLLRRGTPAPAEVQGRVDAVAERYGLRTCPAVTVAGLRTAFVCGVFRPLLALPEGTEADDKVLLHELLHLRHRDAAWGLLIGFFRCVHWCNPLLWYCAGRAGNDIETLCDQRVLERLEGEERRSYGHILLSMAGEEADRWPGTSSMANGARNIRRRVEAIARFKRYPAGMGVAAVCVALIVAAPVALGTAADEVRDLTDARGGDWQLAAAMSAARTAACTTPAGAIDAYGKAVIAGSPVYRALCAPLEEQDALAAELRENLRGRPWERWETELPVYANPQRGYAVYNLTGSEEDGYEGLLALEMAYAPEDAPEPPEHYTCCYLAVQTIRVERRQGRWIVQPREPFRTVMALGYGNLPYLTCDALPAQLYEADFGDFTVRLRWQTVLSVGRYTVQGADAYQEPPDIDAPLDIRQGQQLWAVYTGDEAGKGTYYTIGAVLRPLNPDGSRPDIGSVNPYLHLPDALDGGGSCTGGESWGVSSLRGEWEDEVYLVGGGSDASDGLRLPEGFAVDLYLNRELAAELTLLPVEGGGGLA